MHAIRPIAAPTPASPLPVPSLPAFLLPIGYSLFPSRTRATPPPHSSKKTACETVKLWSSTNLFTINRIPGRAKRFHSLTVSVIL